MQIRASVQPPDGPEQVSLFQPVGRARLAIQLLILAAIVGSFVAAMVPLLGRPFLVGHDGFNGATFSMSAVNILRFGLTATRAGPTRVYWERYPPKETRYYTSKPYGHPLLVTAAYALFGVSERVGRSVSLLFCLALIGLLFFFGLEVGAVAGGLAAAATAASLPMMHQFGSMLTGQIPSLVFVLGFYCSYTWYLRTGALSSSIVAAFFVSLVGGGLLDWHIFVHLPVVVIHLAWTRRHEPKRVLKFFLLLSAIAAVPLLLFAAQTYLLDGFGYVLAKLRQRTGIAPAVAFTWGEFFFRQWHYLCAMYTRAVLLLALLALLAPAPGAAGELQRAARLAAVAALGETLLLNEAIYIHIYYTFIWVVPISLALGSLVERFCQGADRLAVSMVTAILIGFLFTHSYQWVRAAVQASEKQSLPLIRVAQYLGPRLSEGDKVIFYLRPTQFGPQIRYYLKAEFIYARSAWGATRLARRCPECKFVVMKAVGSRLPNAAALRKALLREYPHELLSGYYVFTLPNTRAQQ